MRPSTDRRSRLLEVSTRTPVLHDTSRVSTTRSQPPPDPLPEPPPPGTHPGTSPGPHGLNGSGLPVPCPAYQSPETMSDHGPRLTRVEAKGSGFRFWRVHSTASSHP